MPMPLSRLYSTVSTSPRRTVTDWPTAEETSTSESLAPFWRAISTERMATRAISSCVRGRPAAGTGRSGMADVRGGLEGKGRTRDRPKGSKLSRRKRQAYGRRRVYQQDPAQEADDRPAEDRCGARAPVA